MPDYTVSLVKGRLGLGINLADRSGSVVCMGFRPLANGAAGPAQACGRCEARRNLRQAPFDTSPACAHARYCVWLRRIQAGDVLASLNGAPVVDCKSLVIALQRCAQQVTLTFSRDSAVASGGGGDGRATAVARSSRSGDEDQGSDASAASDEDCSDKDAAGRLPLGLRLRHEKDTAELKQQLAEAREEARRAREEGQSQLAALTSELLYLRQVRRVTHRHRVIPRHRSFLTSSRFLRAARRFACIPFPPRC